ncbi:hypothetical protein KK062_28940, partial [Fulvivirgaceae bacterium PWU5]|nr:hypothetical protein [Dawidia cretensis]
LVKQYPHIDPERLKGGVPVALEKARHTAIELKASFAFETNFSSDLTVELVNHFKHHGYTVSLIYLGLDDIISAETRVATRVMLGSHDVPSDVIKYNFDEGIKRVCDSLNLFDKAAFVDTKRDAQTVALTSAPPFNYQILRNDVGWFNASFHPLLERLKSNQALSEAQKIPVRKKIRRPRKGRGM